ncbi:hypothetical protein ACFVXW_25370 [Streptomyces sp. NPDC058251]|uniref:hypothetical protein n=1 Tax=Streptomyces sp. NPDC058251 TaxID=3346404 RepID=UPI0036E5311E
MKTFAAIIVTVVAMLAGAASQVWLAMLAIGALHSQAPEVPALSFWATAWLLLVGILVMGPALAYNKSSN